MQKAPKVLVLSQLLLFQISKLQGGPRSGVCNMLYNASHSIPRTRYTSRRLLTMCSSDSTLYYVTK